MVQLLAGISEKMEKGHPYMGTERLDALRTRVEEFDESTSATTRHRVLLEAASAEMEAGEVRPAIGLLEEAYGVMDHAYLDLHKRTLTQFRLGMAYLRLGEIENCCLRHTAESCILPLRDGALHSQSEGSRTAIRYFTEVLEAGARQEFFYYASRWLLNVAYMTLGEYPHGVPAAYLISAESFQSGADFPTFSNVAPDLGLDTLNLAGGVVVEDFDNDGRLDILTSTWDPGGAMRLFRATADGTFRECSLEAGLEGITGGLNLIQADYDNDGDVDVLVLRGAWLGTMGRHPNSLLQNDGQGKFTDVTFAAGLGEVHFPTQSAAWSDYDLDGDLDLYIGNEYSKGNTTYGSTTFEGLPAPSQLFRNNGDGTFTDVAVVAGVLNQGFTKGVSWGDFDGDRYPDLLVSNYGGANRLYRNNGDGTFSDQAFAVGLNRPRMSFPCWFWDYNNDGALDIYIASYTGHVAAVGAHYLGLKAPIEQSSLLRGDGSGGFVNVTESTGLDYPILPMGSNFGDLNNDGYLDFYLGTGDPNYWSLMPNVLFLNRRGERFQNVTMASGMGHLQKGHGVALADLDADGDLDVFQQMGGAYPGDAYNDALYQNPGFGNGAVTLKLVGTESNRSAIGTRLKAEFVDQGDNRTVYRWVSSGGSFGASPLRQTIGVGRADMISRLEVYWPASDITQTFEDLPVGGVFEIVEGRDTVEALEIQPVSGVIN
ncbi:MAG: hypothetical protein SynsKO_40860 [Synoicihabitans sp.]